MNQLVRLFLLVLSFSTLNAYQYELAVMSIFRDEADWLQEWVEYHKGIGVEHFYLYNHYSQDDFREVLEPYVESGLVEIIDWKDEKYPQALLTAIKHAISSHKTEVKWLAVIDIDEFIVTHTNNNLKVFLKDYQDCAGLVMNWQLFGTSEVDHLDRDQSMLLSLTWKFPTYFDSEWNSNHWVKSIIRPDRVDEQTKDFQCGNHVFMPIDGYAMVNSNHDPQPIVAKNPNIVVDKIQLNHYWTRTYEWFFQKKMTRRVNVGDKYPNDFLEWLFSESHKEQDFSIQELINN